MYNITFTTAEEVGVVNGPLHSTASIDGLRLADVFATDTEFVVERNGIACGPMPRTEAVPFLQALATAIDIAARDQMHAESLEGFDSITVNQLLDAEFHDWGWLI